MPETAALSLDVASYSAIGGRQANEDALGQTRHGAHACFVVSDGAGGHAGGQQASTITVQAVLQAFAAAPVCSTEALAACVEAASVQVAQHQSATPALHSMSATVAVAAIDAARSEAAWGHLGDTRIYLFRDGGLAHASRDHSLVQQFVDAGLATYAGLRTHPKRNLLYAAIGAEGGTEPALHATSLLAGDALLLCTDGFWEWIDELDMMDSLADADNAQSWLDAMCAIADKAHAASGKERDNHSATAIMVRQA